MSDTNISETIGLALLDLSGNKLLQIQGFLSGINMVLHQEVKNYPIGIYFISIHDGNKYYTKRLVINKK